MNWRSLSPLTKGALAGAAAAVMLLPLGSISLLALAAGGVWILSRRAPTHVFTPPTQSPFGPNHSFLAQQILQTYNNNTVQLNEYAKQTITHNPRIQQVLGPIVAIHGPTSHTVTQINAQINVQLQFQVSGTYGQAQVAVDIQVISQGQVVPKSLTIESQQGIREIVPIQQDTDHSRYKQEIIVDGQVEEVKPTDKS